MKFQISSVTRQKSESQNGYYKKTKHSKFSQKQSSLQVVAIVSKFDFRQSFRILNAHMSFEVTKIFIILSFTAQKMKFSTKNFFSKCAQIRKKLRIWLHLLNKSLMEKFIFCTVLIRENTGKRKTRILMYCTQCCAIFLPWISKHKIWPVFIISRSIFEISRSMFLQNSDHEWPIILMFLRKKILNPFKFSSLTIL